MAEVLGLRNKVLATPSRQRSTATAIRCNGNQELSRRNRTRSTSTSSRSFKVQKPFACLHSATRSKTVDTYSGSNREASFTMQRSAKPPGSPRLTKTGRHSKAKKGLPVHSCLKCGKVRYSSPAVFRSLDMVLLLNDNGHGRRYRSWHMVDSLSKNKQTSRVETS